MKNHKNGSSARRGKPTRWGLDVWAAPDGGGEVIAEHLVPFRREVHWEVKKTNWKPTPLSLGKLPPRLDIVGKPCVVLGNSPAISDTNPELLDKVTTIGVNRILRGYSPSAVLIVDLSVLRKESDRLASYKGELLVWERILPVIIEMYGPDRARSFSLAPRRTSGFVWPETLQDPLVQVGNSPAYALQLAVLLGAQRVGLLGVDFNAQALRSIGKASHFYGEGRAEGATGGTSLSGNGAVFFREAEIWANAKNLSLYNLSPYADTPFSLLGWPRVSLNEFLE